MDLISQYKQTRGSSEAMCAPLEIEDYVPQSIFFASPPKWNLAHTSWFFEEFILKNKVPGYKPFHPIYAYLFNSYYEGAGERAARNERGMLSRPTVKEVYAYRKHVDEQMLKLLENGLDSEAREMVILGINHEQQHQELFFTDHKYALSRNPIYPVYGDTAYAELGTVPEQEWLSFEGGIHEIGTDSTGFAFDNERPKHRVFINPFQISNRLVTNGEFLEFLEEGGYRNFGSWHEEGWKWVMDNQVEHPIYWKRNNGSWQQFTLAGMRDLQPEHPVTHINYYEAYAFAQWKGLRLPTETEWEVASGKLHWGDRWEWTESAYLPYPGFAKAEGTVGEYNGKFMVSQKVLRGASVVTPEGHARNTYRNFFHPQLGWQFTGIRLAK